MNTQQQCLKSGGLGPPSDFEGWSEIPPKALALVKTQSPVIKSDRILHIQALLRAISRKKKKLLRVATSLSCGANWQMFQGHLILDKKNNRNPCCWTVSFRGENAGLCIPFNQVDFAYI